MEKKFIFKETEKAVMVKIRFYHTALESERVRCVWIPKKCIDENGNICNWFLGKKIYELFDNHAGYIMFDGYIVNEEAVVEEEVKSEETKEIVAEEVETVEATVETEAIEIECAKEENADLINYLQDLKSNKKQITMYKLDEFISGYSQNNRYENGDDLEETFIYELKNGDMLETKVSFVGGLKRLLKQVEKEGGDFDFVEEVQIKLKSYKIIKKFQKNY